VSAVPPYLYPNRIDFHGDFTLKAKNLYYLMINRTFYQYCVMLQGYDIKPELPISVDIYPVKGTQTGYANDTHIDYYLPIDPMPLVLSAYAEEIGHEIAHAFMARIDRKKMNNYVHVATYIAKYHNDNRYLHETFIPINRQYYGLGDLRIVWFDIPKLLKDNEFVENFISTHIHQQQYHLV